MSTDIKNSFVHGLDQNKKKRDKTRDTTTGYDTFGISVDFFLQFRPSRMIGGAAGLQVLLATEV